MKLLEHSYVINDIKLSNVTKLLRYGMYNLEANEISIRIFVLVGAIAILLNQCF